MGGTAARFPPWPSGKDSKGNRLGIGSLWRLLSPLSLPLKKVGRRRLTNDYMSRIVKRTQQKPFNSAALSLIRLRLP